MPVCSESFCFVYHRQRAGSVGAPSTKKRQVPPPLYASGSLRVVVESGARIKDPLMPSAGPIGHVGAA